MRSFTRMGGAIVLAATLAISLSVATPASASTTDTSAAGLDRFCSALAETIDFLEGRPASRLRDLLLNHARNLFARYCE